MWVRVDLVGRKRVYVCQCDQCGIEFAGRARSQKRKWHFCSVACTTAGRCKGGVIGDSRYLVLHERKCLFCMRTFSSRIKKRQYCSRTCASESRKNGGLIDAKKRNTCLKTYGVECSFQSQITKEKILNTLITRYGQNYRQEILKNVDYVSVMKKRHETMKSTGVYTKTSSVENDVYRALCEIFGCNYVERHVCVNELDIDLYIRSIDTYVQVDGVYWHGLDRPIEKIQELKSPRDKVILSTIKRDERQNKWFLNNGKRLVRILDKQVKCWKKFGTLNNELFSVLRQETKK